MTIMKTQSDTPISSVVLAALYDFLGFVTSRDISIEVGSSHGPAELLNQFEQWSAQRGLDTSQPGVTELIADWNEHLED